MTEVLFTPAARDLIAAIRADHGAVLLYQNSGCTCGDAPQCFASASFTPSQTDRALATSIPGLTLWRGHNLDRSVAPGTLTIDAVAGRRASFALENLYDRIFECR